MNDRWIIRANHECCHALVALLLGLQVPLCTIDPSHREMPHGAGGYTKLAARVGEDMGDRDLLMALTVATVAPEAIGAGREGQFAADQVEARKWAELAGAGDPLAADTWITEAFNLAVRVTSTSKYRRLSGPLTARLMDELTLTNLELS